MTNRKRIVILFSDTGGGHRASAEAIEEALVERYGEQVCVEKIDVFKLHAPYPFNRFPAWYPRMVAPGRPAEVWGRSYKLSNTPTRSRVVANTVYPYVARAIRRMVETHPADLIISVHALFVIPVVRALGKSRPPIITVVTDLVTVHAWWFDPDVDFTIVPTEGARQKALEASVHPTRVKVLGLPVARKFVEPRADKATLRAELGWDPDMTTVLLVGGGEGMGPLREIATGLAATGLPLQLAVVCGRNESLRAELEAHHWPTRAHIYGFVRNMPDLMRAADLLVTKAGPSSVMEGLNSGLPLVLSDKIPGQEDGNVDFVIDNQAGIWAPGADRVIAAVSELITAGPERLATLTANASALARPSAARDIAEHVGRYLHFDVPGIVEECQPDDA